MTSHFIKLFFRNLSKNKIISGINIAGLVLGLLGTILILEYVFFQWSFDKYQANASDVYRVVYNRYQNGELQWKTANSFCPTGRYLKNTFPEVKEYANISRKYNILISLIDKSGEKQSFNIDKTYYATSSLFNMFSIELIQGNTNGLDKPNSVFLSQRAATKYFGDKNPVGEILTVNNTEKHTIVGVYKTIPSNSHLQSDFLFSFEDILVRNPGLRNNWSGDYLHTYIQMIPGSDYKRFEQTALPQMVQDNYAERLGSRNSRDEYFLQPLPDIHLHSNIEYETETPGNAKAVKILFGFAIFFIIIAWVNYINLVTAKAIERAKEIGIKKVSGKTAKSLVFQFIGEAFLFNLISSLIVVGLWFIINPFYMRLTGIDSITSFLTIRNGMVALLFFVGGILLSSLYPAFVLSSFKPASILKGKFGNTKQGIAFRKSLVTVQFVVSIILLTGTIITYQQVNFLLQKDMGLNYKSKIAIKAPKPGADHSVYSSKLKVLENKLASHPAVENYTFASEIPGQEINSWFFGYRKGFDRTDGKAYFRIDIDQHFGDFYDIKMLAGRHFRESDQEGQRNILLNEKGMQRLGYTNPEEAINKVVTNGRVEYQIIGIFQDFNFYSVKVDPVPTVFTLRESSKQFMGVQISQTSMASLQPVLKDFQNTYAEVFPGSPFDYSIIEQKATTDLSTDKTFAAVFGVFSFMAIAVSVIGILGLIIITINQNLKEMGVRKVLGAELSHIYVILTKSMSKQFIVAILVAVPLGIYGFQKWFLNTYKDHINLSWVHLMVPVLLLSIILMLIIYIQAQKVTRLSTTSVLKSE